MKIHAVSLVLIDISGYTQFTRLHRLSALHAEKIVSELLESIIKRARHPLIVHEILGDAVSFYAQSDGKDALAHEIRRQIVLIFDAFRLREGELISDCSLCVCEACRNVGKLQLKAILHHGQAVFGTVRSFQKISGEDVILAHRLLKNSVPNGEYILETEAFYRLGGPFAGFEAEERIESCEGFDAVPVRVYYIASGKPAVTPARRSLSSKLKRSWTNDWYSLQRLFKPRPPGDRYREPRSMAARIVEQTHIPPAKNGDK